MFCYENDYNDDYGLADILVYKNFHDVPNEVLRKWSAINEWKILWQYAENGIIYIWEYKATPVVQILIYETNQWISDTVKVLYKKVNLEELKAILDKYR